jgi:hypothetical protein
MKVRSCRLFPIFAPCRNRHYRFPTLTYLFAECEKRPRQGIFLTPHRTGVCA